MTEERTEQQSEKQSSKTAHLAKFQWTKGVSGNPNGRPKGQTLKEFAREYLESLPEDRKLEYLATLPSEIVWKMAEGNPHTTEDKRIEVVQPTPILGGVSNATHIEAAVKEELLD